MTVDREPRWTATPAPQPTDVPLRNRALAQASVRRVVDGATACFPVNAPCSKKKSVYKTATFQGRPPHLASLPLLLGTPEGRSLPRCF